MSELALKQVAGPLKRVLDSIREVLQSTDGNRLLGRVLGAAVGFRYFGNHHL